jgi:hypothetical protein
MGSVVCKMRDKNGDPAKRHWLCSMAGGKGASGESKEQTKGGSPLRRYAWYVVCYLIVAMCGFGTAYLFGQALSLYGYWRMERVIGREPDAYALQAIEERHRIKTELEMRERISKFKLFLDSLESDKKDAKHAP